MGELEHLKDLAPEIAMVLLFGTFVITILKIGIKYLKERNGNLEKILERLCDKIDKVEDTVSRCKWIGQGKDRE